MAFTVYVLQSEATGRLYIGQAEDLDRRLKEHEAGQTRAMRRRGPWQVIYTQAFPTRAEAVQNERWLKSLKNQAYLLDYVRSR